MKARHISCLFLALTLLASSCQNADSQPDSTPTDTDGTTSDAGETTAESYQTDLPELDFGGEELRIYNVDPDAAAWVTPQLDAETETGDLVNDAIYKRNRLVESQLNIVIKETRESGAYEVDNLSRNIAMSGEDSYELLNLNDRTALAFAQDGLIRSFDELEYIDLDKPYWSSTLNSSLSIGGKLYFAYGDYNLTTYDYTHVLCFNKELAEQYNIESLYDLVNEGKWTYDKFREVTAVTTADLNGDNIMDGEDCYGFTAVAKQILPCFWIAAGEQSIEKNASDIPEFNLASDERFFDVIEKIFNITYDNNSFMMTSSLFKKNQSFITDNTFKLVSSLRDAVADFGIIPYPKYDESQTEYYSRVEGGMIPVVPVASEKLELIGAALEALACESRNIVIPAYYNIALQTKVARDDESAEMLDLIFNGRVYDLGDTYWCNLLRDGIFNDMFENNERDLASKIASVEAQVNAQIQKSVDAFASLDG